MCRVFTTGPLVGDDLDTGGGEAGPAGHADVQTDRQPERSDRIGDHVRVLIRVGQHPVQGAEEHVPARSAGQVEPADPGRSGRRGLGRSGWRMVRMVRVVHVGVGHPSTVVRSPPGS